MYLPRLLLPILALSPISITAGEACPRCGVCLKKVCRPVCETKEVKEVEWGVACEEFCVPGPSRRVACADDCGRPATQWVPACGQVRTRKKLVKKEVAKQVPSVRWVVETVACDCCP